MGATKKGKAAKGKSKKSGGGKRGGWMGGSKVGATSLFEVGAIMTVGAVILGKLCNLPGWLSPVGAALWLWGWWKGNAELRKLGILMIGTGFVSMLGIPAAVGEKVDEAQKQGMFGNFFGFGVKKTAGPGGAPGGSRNGKSIDELVENVVDISDAVAAVRTALA